MSFVSITQLAASLGVTRQAVFLCIKRGAMRAIRVGTHWIIPSSEVAAWEKVAAGKSSRLKRKISRQESAKQFLTKRLHEKHRKNPAKLPHGTGQGNPPE